MENRLSRPNLTPETLQTVPIERAETIPSAWYTDPAFHAWDNESIFSHHWQCAGHVSRVSRAGDYFLIDVAGNPLIVVRGKDEQVRAFYNVCRHRGGPLEVEESGCVKALQCKYHGWTYWLDGMLRGVPEFDYVQLFDRKDYGLIPVKLETWEGLIFVNLSENPAPLNDFVAGISERIAPIRLADKKFYRKVEYQIRCNWKVYVDNYLEGYHLPYVHPELNKLLDYRNYVTETFPWYSLQYSPFAGGDNLYRAEKGEAFYYFIFPNIMLNILPGRLQTNLVLPLAQDKTLVIFEYYYDDVTSPRALQIIAEDIDYSDRVQQEDIEICERVQMGLNSPAYDRGRFSVLREQGVYHFQSLLKEAYWKGISDSPKGQVGFPMGAGRIAD